MSRGPGILAVAALIVAGASALPAATLAQEIADDKPAPVIIVGNTRFTPLFEDVVLAPGERARRELPLAHFTRVSLLAAGESGPNPGRVAVATVFGPPAVPVPNRLDLVFEGDQSARRADTMVVMGPVLHVEIANLSRLPVRVSMSAFAAR